MHSSRKRTVRSSGRLRGVNGGGGVCSGGSLPKCMLGYTLPWEQTPPRADTPLSRHPSEQTPPKADPLGSTHPPGAYTPLSRHPPKQTPPVNRITDRCKNITFATFLRTVIIELWKLAPPRKILDLPLYT